MELVIVELAGQRYGLRADAVREVVRSVTITTLPNAPVVVEGIINVRGTVIAVLDLRRRFDLPGRTLDPAEFFVLAHARDRDVALRVDRATELISVDPGEIDRAEPLLSRSRYIAGVAKLPDGLVLIHDLETFLSAAEAADLDRALTERAGAET